MIPVMSEKDSITVKESDYIKLDDADLSNIHRLMSDEFPNTTKEEINYAILDCCCVIAPPRSRELFMACLRRKMQNINSKVI
jgi:hypothetical protein